MLTGGKIKEIIRNKCPIPLRFHPRTGKRYTDRLASIAESKRVCGKNCSPSIKSTQIWRIYVERAPNSYPSLCGKGGGYTTKIHATTDGLGNPLQLVITGGNRHDIIGARELLGNQEVKRLIGDRAFDVQLGPGVGRFWGHRGSDSSQNMSTLPKAQPAIGLSFYR